jgi:hypothetical protein
VVAAAAAAASVAVASSVASGDLDRQLLDDSLGSWEEEGCRGGLNPHHSGLTGSSRTGAGSGIAGAKGAGSGRQGVVVMLLAEGLEVIGEKGTKVRR